jgi:hypothetical protein
MTVLTKGPKVPSDLFSIQKWFANIITRPIDHNSQMNPISPSGRLMSEEAEDFILPNTKLSSAQRIQIYNQQYWWRLLSMLHKNFPALTRLFGYADFNNTIGMPFLTVYPSRHWSLAKLGNQLSHWIEQYYKAEDTPLILATAEVDWAYQSIFFAPPPLYLPPSMDLLSKTLTLQPHLKIFNFPFDIFSLRTTLLKEEVEFWLESDFPVLLRERNYFFVLFRTRENQIQYKEVEEAQWIFLDLINKGLSINTICDCLEKQEKKICKDAESHLDRWIQEWINEKWLLM